MIRPLPSSGKIARRWFVRRFTDLGWNSRFPDAQTLDFIALTYVDAAYTPRRPTPLLDEFMSSRTHVLQHAIRQTGDAAAFEAVWRLSPRKNLASSVFDWFLALDLRIEYEQDVP